MTVILRGFLVASAVLLVLLGLSVPFIERGTGTFAIALVSFVMLAVMFLGSAAFVYADWDPFEELLS